VVGATALVTGSGTSTSSEATTTEAASVATSGNGGTARNAYSSRVGARTSQVSRLTTVVAAAASPSTGQAQSRTVSLNVAEALAVIALLCLSRTRERALVRFVA
jgi:hypothetical protein